FGEFTGKEINNSRKMLAWLERLQLVSSPSARTAVKSHFLELAEKAEGVFYPEGLRNRLNYIAHRLVFSEATAPALDVAGAMVEPAVAISQRKGDGLLRVLEGSFPTTKLLDRVSQKIIE